MKSLIFVLIITIGSSFAKEVTNLKSVENEAIKMGKKYGPARVLVVLDIDNTILTMPRQFGSDQWFTWQSKNCLGKSFNPEYCIAKDFNELLDVQGQIFAVSEMVPTQKNTVSIVKNLQKKGFKVILLTSRGPEFRSATEKEIKRIGLDFNKSAIGPSGGYGGSYKPYRLNTLQRNGLRIRDVRAAGLKKPRLVSYQNGIYMTAGQNKGIMLRNLLAKTSSSFKGIVFADDHKKHIVRMNMAFEGETFIEVKTFRYGGVDRLVVAFSKDARRISKKGVLLYNALQYNLKHVP